MSKGTALDALMAELLGDVGKLHDQVAKLNATIPTTAKIFESMNQKLLADRSRILDSLKDVHVAAAKPESERAVVFAVLICCVAFLGVLVLGMSIGNDKFKRDKAIQSAWSHSADITMLAECSGKGWRIENINGETYCMPHPYTASDGNQYVAGWRIAKQSN